MNIRAILAATVLLSACSQKPVATTPSELQVWAEATKPCADEISDVVLRKLSPTFNRSVDSIAELDRYDNNLKCVREWADTLKDQCVKDEYGRWLNHFEGESRRKREDLAKPESDIDKWWKEIGAKDRRIRAYERQHPIPAPPPDACERSLIEKVKP